MILPEYTKNETFLNTISGSFNDLAGQKVSKDVRDLIIPKNYTSLSNTAFQYSSKLETIYLYTEKLSSMTSNVNSWTNCNALKNIYVPAEALSAYQKSTFWKAKLDCLKPLS